MIIASATNEAVVLHLHLQQCYLRQLSTVNIIVARQHSKYRRTIYHPTKYVVHWNGKLLPNVTGVDADKVDR